MINLEEGINVASFFDGISGGQISLMLEDIKVKNYYASEIDKDAMKVTNYHFPNTIQLGDITKLKANQFENIDLILCGSPCQSFSRVGDGSGFDGKSGLFWNFIDLFKQINPKYFLFENVVMKKEWEDIITEALGVKPIKINSSLLTAQNRPRLYWTNIPNVTQPTDKGLVIKDVINCEFSHNYPNYLNLEFCGKVIKDLVKNYKTKASCLTATMYKGQISSFVKNDDGLIYKLTPNDCEILQSLPLDYTKILSNTQRYKSIGNGWTIDVIRHILKNLKDV